MRVRPVPVRFALALAGGLLLLAPRARGGERVETYKSVGGVELALHVYEPPGHQASDRRPAIVLFFGGGWKEGEPAQFAEQCRYLAERGMLAMSADYRVLSRQGTRAKEAVQDAKSAIRWVRTEAARLGVDPERIAAGGSSSGGHIAACAGLITGWEEPGEPDAVSSVPDALVLFNPLLALAPFDGYVPAAQPGAEDLAERVGADLLELSPAHHVRAGQPPTLLLFGTKDILLRGARYFDQEMRLAGNRCEVVLYEGQKHGFFHYGLADNVYFERTLADADRFLTSLGYLSGEPRVTAWMERRRAEAGLEKPR